MKKAMAALILFLIETLLFYLYAIPTEAWAYSSVFIILIFGGWTGIDEIRKRKKCEQLKTIRKEAEVYLEMEHFGKPEDAVEREYQNLAELLGRQWENAKQEASCQISEANRYYIRWSHQIKTPIAALRLLLEEEELDRSAMAGEVYRIEQYVEAALQYQRLESGQKDLPRIFEWGYTGYNGRIKNRATGIGLALCRQTMEMLGHRISAKSEPGKGTCIYLDLAVDPVRDY